MVVIPAVSSPIRRWQIQSHGLYCLQAYLPHSVSTYCTVIVFLRRLSKFNANLNTGSVVDCLSSMTYMRDDNWQGVYHCITEFLDVIGTKVLRVRKKSLRSFPPWYSQSPLLTDFTQPPPPPLSKRCLKLVCNVKIVYGNLKSETLLR